MTTPVDLAISHSRTTLTVLLFLLISGALAYLNIPKEASPDVAVPIINVSIAHEGISPEDAEQLILRPVEQKLKTIAGITEIDSTAYAGGASVQLQFDAGFDVKTALNDVRNKTSEAKADLPPETSDPVIEEVNPSLFPILVVSLSGDVPERTLLSLAQALKDDIENIPSVLSANIQGSRDPMVEVIIDPVLLNSYRLSIAQVINGIQNDNILVAAGALEVGAGRFAVKVPGLIETAEDVLNLPIKATTSAIVRLRDVATVRRTFKDATTVSRMNGKPAMSIEVVKRAGENIIATIANVRTVVESHHSSWPVGLEVIYSQDQSKQILQLLDDLQNSVILAILLVMVVLLFTLSFQAAVFVGIAIPTSFLMGILVLSSFDLTVNMVVLFSLILAVGMLVDDAIIVAEYAERQLAAGMTRGAAYASAARHMAKPVIASTLTRLAAFSPLLFWPGVVGEFMKFMPITLIATLSASLIVALFFTPTLGALFGRRQSSEDTIEHEELSGVYVSALRLALRYPGTVLVLVLVLMVAVQYSYAHYGKGVDFFPNVEPDQGLVYVHARGDLSLFEQDYLVREVEQHILGMPELASVYTRVGGGGDVSEDVIGVIQFEFIDWRQRRPANDIITDIRQRTAAIPGIGVEVRTPQSGPQTGKPIQIQLASTQPELLQPAAAKVAQALQAIPGVIDLDDASPLPGIDWEIDVNRQAAATFSADIRQVGFAVLFVTSGIKITDYRPSDSNQTVDIILRYPKDRRTLDTLDHLWVNTNSGVVPISNFVIRVPQPRVGQLHRVDSKRVVTVQANLKAGVLAKDVQTTMNQWLQSADLDKSINVRFRGEDEERQKASQFLAKAFGVALFMIFIILLTQFNSFFSVALVLSAVILSTIGVFIGMLITGQTFDIVMTGIGIIALAGVVVNNNIILIDTFDQKIHTAPSPRDAVLATGAQRMRPVLLTAATAVLGVLPIAFGINIDFLTREITMGAPATQWWIQLSTAMVFGLSFATVLTLFVTPCALMLRENLRAFWRKRRALADTPVTESSIG